MVCSAPSAQDARVSDFMTLRQCAPNHRAIPHSRHRPVAVVEGSLTKNVNKTGVRLWTDPTTETMARATADHCMGAQSLRPRPLRLRNRRLESAAPKRLQSVRVPNGSNERRYSRIRGVA